MQRDASRYEGWGDALQIEAELAHGNVAAQVTLMPTGKRSQEIADRSPETFKGIGMHFANAIAVIIARPFLLAVTDRRV